MIETSIGTAGSVGSDNWQAAIKVIAPIDESPIISSNVVLDKVTFDGTTDASKILQV